MNMMTDVQVSATVKVAEIDTTAGTQSRVALSESTVSEYADRFAQGDTPPPVVVFHDGSAYWLADGFHRVMAATRAGVAELPADVRKGTKRDAILYSVGANANHGLPRTNADKRRAVEMLLNDEEWVQWSDREIGRRCAVTHNLVSSIRQSILGTEPSIKKFTHPKTGQVSTMQTENIGRKSGYTGARADKIEIIREMAHDGNRASQIAKKVGLEEKTVRLYASEAGITLADSVIGKTAKIDSRRVIEQSVLSLEASAQSFKTVPVSFDGITQEEAAEWAEVVGEALRIFRQFHKQLKETANG